MENVNYNRSYSYKFVCNTDFKTIIFKIDISDHFRTCFLQPTSISKEENKATYITKRVINNNAIESLNRNYIRSVGMIP